MHVDERSSGTIFFVVAAIFFLTFTGLLVKLHLDANASPTEDASTRTVTSAPAATSSLDRNSVGGGLLAAVTAAYRERTARLPAIVRDEVHNVQCSANVGTRNYTCQFFISADGKRGLLEKYLLRRVSHCAGTEHCLPVGSRFYSLSSAGETKMSA
jgi:hypothetical protein